jgi:hypothetical protein
MTLKACREEADHTRAALRDPKLLGSALAGESWRAWRTILIVAMSDALARRK